MLFGRSLFGGPLYPRQVTAGGTAMCAAQAGATASAGYRVAGGLTGAAAVATAPAVKVLIPAGSTVGQAQVLPAPAVAEFRPGALTWGLSSATGGTRADYSGAGDAVAEAIATALIRRRVSVRFNAALHARAELVADGDLYALAFGEPAVCHALPFGTYWKVGSGNHTVVAAPVADAQLIVPAAGHAAVAATTGGAARVDGVAAGSAALGVAEGDSDPMQLIQGIEHWFARGEALAVATAAADPYVYSVALAVARALPQAASNTRRKAEGTATGRASATAYVELIAPQIAQLTVESSASGDAAIRLSASGRAKVGAQGAAQASANLAAAASVAVQGHALVALGRMELAVSLEAAAVTAQGNAFVTRNVFGGGAAGCVAVPSARGQLWLTAGGISEGFALPSGGAALHPKQDVSGVATASASPAGAHRMAHPAAGSAGAQASVVGAHRMAHRAAVDVQAVAVASAANIVNDARQPLTSRLVIVSAELRSFEVPAAARTIEISGDARRMAA